MPVPTEFHSILCRIYHTLWISVRRPITEVKAEWNASADVWEIALIELGCSVFSLHSCMSGLYFMNGELAKEISKFNAGYYQTTILLIHVGPRSQRSPENISATLINFTNRFIL